LGVDQTHDVSDELLNETIFYDLDQAAPRWRDGSPRNCPIAENLNQFLNVKTRFSQKAGVCFFSACHVRGSLSRANASGG
jgi:hypothetical protein